MIGLKGDMESRQAISRLLPLAQGDSASAFGTNGIVLSSSFSTTYGIGAGDTFNVSWRGKYDTTLMTATFKATAVTAAPSIVPVNSFFVNERNFYRKYYLAPTILSAAVRTALPDSSSPFYKLLAPEYTLMKWCATTQELHFSPFFHL
jgi:hypothetical protein